VGLPDDIGTDPARVEQLNGTRLSVIARPVAAIVGPHGIAAHTEEVWVDGEGDVNRYVEELTVRASGPEPVSLLLIADRSGDVLVDPPFVKGVVPLPAAVLRAGDRLPGERSQTELASAAHIQSSSRPAAEARRSIPNSAESGQLLLATSGRKTATNHCTFVWRPITGGGARVECPPEDVLELRNPADLLPPVIVPPEQRDLPVEPPPQSDANLHPFNFTEDQEALLQSGATCANFVLTMAIFVNGGGAAALAASGPVSWAIFAILLAILAIYCGNFLDNAEEALLHGEPHIVTLDRTGYDLQAVGEFVYMRASELEVQSRFLGTKGTNTSSQATAVRVGQHVVESYFEDQPDEAGGLPLIVDGGDVVLAPEGRRLADGTLLLRGSEEPTDRTLIVISPAGSYVRVENLNVSQNVIVGLVAADARNTSGLVGVVDGEPGNDLALRDGSVVPLHQLRTIEGLYGTFAEAWRVRPNERLFTRGKANDFLTPDYTSLPELAGSLADFSSADIADARGHCREAGVPSGEAMDACAYDVLATGDGAWALQAGRSAATASIGSPPPLGMNLGNEAEGDDPLLVAADRCRLPELRELIASGADPNVARANDGWTPLQFASKSGCLTGVQALLEAGADPSIASRDGATPLYLAAQVGDDEIARALISSGADPRAALPSGDTALLVAAFRGQTEVVNVLVDAGAPVDVSRDDGFSPLLAGTQERHVKIVEILLARGANPNQTNANGDTPLMLASDRGDLQIAQILLGAGADADRKRLGDDVRALHFAALRGHVEVVRALLEAGAEADPMDKEGVRPLHLAAHNDDPVIAAILLAAGANPDAEDNQGRSPRELAGPGVSALLD
jgi:ankyrin repeat protein